MLLSVPICIIPLYYMCNVQLFVQSCLTPTILQRPTPVHEKICVQTLSVIFAERLWICLQLIYGICSGHLSERFQSVTGMDPYTPIMVAMGAVWCFVFPLHQLVHSHQICTHVCVLKFPILSWLLKSVLFLYILCSIFRWCMCLHNFHQFTKANACSERLFVPRPIVIFAEQLSTCLQSIAVIYSGDMSRGLQLATGNGKYTPVISTMHTIWSYVFPLCQLAHNHQPFTLLGRETIPTGNFRVWVANPILPVGSFCQLSE